MNHKLVQTLGILFGLVIAGYMNILPWTTLAMILAGCILLILVIPPTLSTQNARITTISTWISIGMLLVLVASFAVGNMAYLGWAVIAWIAISVIVGSLWPFPSLNKR